MPWRDLALTLAGAGVGILAGAVIVAGAVALLEWLERWAGK